MTILSSPPDRSFVALLEAAPDAMACVAANDRIVLVNAQLERLFGYRREELIDQPVEILVPDAIGARHPGLWAGYVADPQPRLMSTGPELAGRRRDGSVFPADISLCAIDIDDGLLLAIAVRDVTERRRVTDLEAFTYSVAHDLRAPLRALSGFSEALLEDYGDALDDEGRDFAQRIVESSEQMATLIEDLLRLSSGTLADMQLRTIDLGAEAAEIAGELQRHDPQRRVSLAIQRPVLARADPALIRTVLQNLLENAWKFTSGQGDASIEFGATKDGDGRLCCYVRDDGPGFDPAYNDKLFQPFQRLHTTQEFSGTGVGLASVRQIVERHGGRVRAEGAIGKGAAFYFTLEAEELT